MNRENKIKILTDNIKLHLKLSMLQLINDLTIESSAAPVSLKMGSLLKERGKQVTVLSRLLKNSDSDRTEFGQKLSALRIEALKEADPVFKVMNYSSLINDMLIYELKTRKYNEADSGFEAEMAIDMLHSALHGFDGAQLNYLLCRLMCCIPCRMSKNIFNDYIKRAADYAVKNAKANGEAAWFFNMLKDKALPFSDKNAREAFPDEYEKLDGILYKNISSEEDENLSKLAEDISAGTREIYDIADVVSMVYTDFGYMLILGLYGYDIDFITDGDVVLKDFFYAAAEYASKEKTDEADDDIAIDIYEQTSDMIEELMEETEKADEKVLKNIEEIENQAQKDDSLSHIYTIYKIVKSLYIAEAESGNESLYNGSGSPDDVFDINKSVDEFCEYIAEVTRDIPAYNKKLVRRELMAQLICPYSMHEVIDYISSALSYYKGKTAVNNIYEAILEVIDLSETSHHDHHHHHDHQHDHAHDHHHHDEHFHKHL